MSIPITFVTIPISMICVPLVPYPYVPVSYDSCIPVKYGSLQYVHPYEEGIPTTHLHLSFENLYNMGLYKMYALDWSVYNKSIPMNNWSLYQVYPSDWSVSIKCITVIGRSYG